MSFSHGKEEASAKLCRALGLDPSVTVSVHLVMSADRATSVIVEQLVTTQQVERLAKAIRRFEIVEKPVPRDPGQPPGERK